MFTLALFSHCSPLSDLLYPFFTFFLFPYSSSILFLSLLFQFSFHFLACLFFCILIFHSTSWFAFLVFFLLPSYLIFSFFHFSPSVIVSFCRLIFFFLLSSPSLIIIFPLHFLLRFLTFLVFIFLSSPSLTHSIFSFHVLFIFVRHVSPFSFSSSSFAISFPPHLCSFTSSTYLFISASFNSFFSYSKRNSSKALIKQGKKGPLVDSS